MDHNDESQRATNVTAAIHELTQSLEAGLTKLISHLPGTAGGGGTTPVDVPTAARSDDREEVLIRYTTGWGQFDRSGRWNHLHMEMFKMDGTRDGTHDGVWSAYLHPAGLYDTPDKPTGPLDAPEGPIGAYQIRAWTKAIWTFGDHSSVTAVGPANLHLVRLTGEDQIFLVSVAAIITNGTGKYQGARGVKTALGSTFVPKGTDLFPKPGQNQERFKAVTVETFRIVRADNMAG